MSFKQKFCAGYDTEPRRARPTRLVSTRLQSCTGFTHNKLYYQNVWVATGNFSADSHKNASAALGMFDEGLV